ncbi:LysR family transcriptional regulator [Gluconacetobacter johannae DSM 13595]|uniref:LysR family transcriptional regulator n=1 Tax=Gluconacetobacter johannae TaxID=112140 RepID=A0A7W4J9J7_9PROT|nr:LysR family transcriptional regulator [Gluconacetobacter johannae]MBB2177189.1 LysR family transcriptional regulator [Gluconacetobacter johannae]GBQ82142.1 LysR family transcriptional regulator [Gluconacetobacter johannae DSM 13595]
MRHLLTRLKFRHLTLVLSLEESCNLHRTSDLLNMSQPTATKLLQEIEHTLGVPLFERRPKGMVPTPFGSLVARHARLMLSDIGRLQQDIDELRTGISGVVRIGTVVAAMPDLVAPAVGRIIGENPRVSISLTTDNSDVLLVELQNGRIDLMVGRPISLVENEDLNVETLEDEDLRIVVGPDHPLLARGDLALRDLVGERWLLQPGTSPMRRAIDAAFTVERLSFPPHPVESASVTATICMLAETSLIAVLPHRVSAFFVRRGIIAELPVQLPRILRPYAMVTLRNRPAGNALTRMMALLRAGAAGDGTGG